MNLLAMLLTLAMVFAPLVIGILFFFYKTWAPITSAMLSMIMAVVAGHWVLGVW